MSGKHQGLRYFQKFLNSKASESNALAKKVLRCVLAVGFVLSPWLGGEAYAGTPNEPGIVRVDGTKFLDGTSKSFIHGYTDTIICQHNGEKQSIELDPTTMKRILK